MNAVEEFFNPPASSDQTAPVDAPTQTQTQVQVQVPNYSSSYQVAPSPPPFPPSSSSSSDLDNSVDSGVDEYSFPDNEGESWTTMDWKSVAIAVLVFLLVLVFARVDVVGMFTRVAYSVQNGLTWILRGLGYTTGTVIAGGAHMATTGAEIVGSAVEDAGTAIADTANPDTVDSTENVQPADELGFTRSYRKTNDKQAAPIKRVQQDDMAYNGSDGKKKSGGWCLAGLYGGKRGCVAVDDASMCTSGKLYPTKEACQQET